MSKLAQAPTAYTFDDFLLAPGHSDVESRKHPKVSTDICGIRYNTPVISSPMNTVTEVDMLRTMSEAGGTGVLHRYMSIEDQVDQAKEALELIPRYVNGGFFVAVGANGDAMERVERLWASGVRRFCIDVANGHSVHCLKAVRHIKQKHPKAYVMAGNVCTYDGALRLAQAGANAIRVGIGGGCFVAGTRVLMGDGMYKNIEDIRAGDKVINMNGDPVKVKKSWCTGHKKVLKLRHTQFYKETYCTPDHEFFVGDLNRLSDNTITARGYAKSLREGDFMWSHIKALGRAVLLMPNKIKFDMPISFKIPLLKRSGGNNKSNFTYKVDSTLKSSYKSGYMIGMFLGDGNAHCSDYKNSKRGSVSWYLGTKEKDKALKLCKAVYGTVGKNPSFKFYKNMIQVNLHYKPLADILNTFGKKDEKHLPSKFLVSDREYLQGLYDGLIDSDGHEEKSNGRVGFTNTSPQLVELFGLLNYMIKGTFPDYRREKKSCGKHINIANLKDSYSSRVLKQAKKRISGNMQIVKILEKTDGSTKALFDSVPVYDIEVDCPTHSFVANNAIVHNSMCTTRLVTGHGMPQLTAIEDCAKIKVKGNRHSDNSLVPSEFSEVAIIADGGIRGSNDIIKALAIGADAVMLGGLLAGTEETPGEWIEENGQLYKYYAGMASEVGRAKWFDRGKTGFVPEGVSTKILYNGKTASKVLENLMGELKVGMSYSGAHNLAELREKAQWVRITGAGVVEGTPHGK